VYQFIAFNKQHELGLQFSLAYRWAASIVAGRGASKDLRARLLNQPAAFWGHRTGWTQAAASRASLLQRNNLYQLAPSH